MKKSTKNKSIEIVAVNLMTADTTDTENHVEATQGQDQTLVIDINKIIINCM